MLMFKKNLKKWLVEASTTLWACNMMCSSQIRVTSENYLPLFICSKVSVAFFWKLETFNLFLEDIFYFEGTKP